MTRCATRRNIAVMAHLLVGRDWARSQGECKAVRLHTPAVDIQEAIARGINQSRPDQAGAERGRVVRRGLPLQLVCQALSRRRESALYGTETLRVARGCSERPAAPPALSVTRRDITIPTAIAAVGAKRRGKNLVASLASYGSASTLVGHRRCSLRCQPPAGVNGAGALLCPLYLEVKHG